MRTLLIATAALTLASAQVPPGEIAGRIVDAAGSVVPGARVTATLGGERREAVTNVEGRFALPALPLGEWDVTAELAGFKTRQAVFPLSAARRVDAIVHVRIETDHGSVTWSDHRLCASVRRDFTARAVAVSLERGGGLESGSAVRLISEPHLPALVPGREYVVLLWRVSPHSDTWTYSDRLALPVVDGLVRVAREPELDGLSVADALELLGRWSRAQGRID